MALSRDSALLGLRPQPPKPVSLIGGTIVWEKPRETANVTHYVIYGARFGVFEKVPVGQTRTTAFPENIAIMFSVDDRTGNRSHDVSITGTGAADGGGGVTLDTIPVTY